MISEGPVTTAISEEDLSVPASILAESFVPQYQFNWQNPNLEATIYPFRKAKLIDFLAYFAEIDLVRQNKGKDETDPEIKALIDKYTAEIMQERTEVEAQLEKLVAERQESDPWFNKISNPDIKTLRGKQAYYLDREIDRLQSKLNALLEQQKSLLKRQEWYGPDDPDDDLQQQRKKMWRDRAAELDPEIQEIKAKLDPDLAFRALYERIAQFPDVSKPITKHDVMRIQMRARRQEWENLDENQILHLIIDQINAAPDQYPEWLIYMVIHFSGMRYISAHGSWADPRYLLENLLKEDEEDEVNAMADLQVAEECQKLQDELKKSYDSSSKDPKQKTLGVLIERLGKPIVQRTALRTYRIDQIIAKVQALPDDKACLDGLVQYRSSKENTPDCIPDWAWNEIVKYTPLRLNTDSPTWEAFSPERWQARSQRWTQVLNDWERKDITSWRKKHHDSLSLVVTRSVCNELAEQIQDLRGLTPVGGLTARPVWYIRMAAKNPLHAYFRQAPAEGDFKQGASILFMQWMDEKPSPWQVAHPLKDYNLIPAENKPRKPGMRGEVPKKDLIHYDNDREGGWSSKSIGDAYIRTRPLPNTKSLRAMGKSLKEARKIVKNYKTSGSSETQYLRWRHEATVVGVFEMIDGKFVMTFETGQIGVNLRRLSSLAGSPMVFVGYVPDNPQMPKDMDEKLVSMLDWHRILPDANLPPRVRPKKLSEAEDTGSTTTPETASPGEPQRTVLVIHGDCDNPRDPLKCKIFTSVDNQGRPKFFGANSPVRLRRGTRLGVSKIAKESANDAGDGIIHGSDGLYLKITACQDQPQAVGLYISADQVADYSAGKWVQLQPDLLHTTPQLLAGYDKKGKPYFDPLPAAERPKAQILPGKDFRFRISTNHKECFLDLGDGLINSSGRVNTYYLILECPKVLSAGGLFIESEEIIPEAVLAPPIGVV